MAFMYGEMELLMYLPIQSNLLLMLTILDANDPQTSYVKSSCESRLHVAVKPWYPCPREICS